MDHLFRQEKDYLIRRSNASKGTRILPIRKIIDDEGKFNLKNYNRSTNAYLFYQTASIIVRGLGNSANKKLSKDEEYKPLLKHDDSQESQLDTITLLSQDQRTLKEYINYGFEGADKIDADALKVEESKKESYNYKKDPKKADGIRTKNTNLSHNNKGKGYQQF